MEGEVKRKEEIL